MLLNIYLGSTAVVFSSDPTDTRCAPIKTAARGTRAELLSCLGIQWPSLPPPCGESPPAAIPDPPRMPLLSQASVSGAVSRGPGASGQHIGVCGQLSRGNCQKKDL